MKDSSTKHNRLPAFSIVASTVFFIAFAISLWEIIARYVFDTPTIWGHESVIALVALGYLLGGIHVFHQQQHIGIRLLADTANEQSRARLELFSTCVVVLFFAGSAMATLPAALSAWVTPSGYWRIEGTGSAWNPPTPALIKSALLLTLLTLLILACQQLWQRATRFFTLRPGAGVNLQREPLWPALLIALTLITGGALGYLSPTLGIGITSLLLVALILLLALCGVPLAFATGATALLVTLAWFGWDATPLLTSRVYSFINEYVLVAVPMFVFMAALLDRSGLATDLYNAMRASTPKLSGGLALQTLLAGLFLAAVSGIIGGEIVLLGLIALPQMLRLGYSQSIAIGTVCAGGSLGTMIPPSIVLIVYGLTSRVAISDLFLAAIIPGMLLACAYLIYIYCQCRFNPSHQVVDAAEVIPKMSRKAITIGFAGPLLVMTLVLGSIYGGIASITEAACLGVASVLFLSFVRRRFRWKDVQDALIQTLEACGMIIWVGIGASLLVGIYNLMGGNQFVQELVLGLNASPLVVIIAMMGVLMVLGLFLDWIGIALLCMPIFVPIVVTLGLDPIWFGILFAVNMQMSYLTPPFGPAAFYLKSVAPPEIQLGTIYRAVWPFVLIQFLVLAILIAFPQITLWLPRAVY